MPPASAPASSAPASFDGDALVGCGHLSSPALSQATKGERVRSPGVVGRSTISYADVVVYEASLGGQAVRPRPRAAVPVAVSNLIMIILESDIADEVSTYVEDFSTSAIFSY